MGRLNSRLTGGFFSRLMRRFSSRLSLGFLSEFRGGFMSRFMGELLSGLSGEFFPQISSRMFARISGEFLCRSSGRLSQLPESPRAVSKGRDRTWSTGAKLPLYLKGGSLAAAVQGVSTPRWPTWSGRPCWRNAGSQRQGYGSGRKRNSGRLCSAGSICGDPATTRNSQSRIRASLTSRGSRHRPLRRPAHTEARCRCRKPEAEACVCRTLRRSRTVPELP